MKKIFNKNAYAKIIIILTFIGALLTWIFKFGYFDNGKYVSVVKSPIGLTSISELIFSAISFSFDKLIYLFSIMLFYYVLRKTNSYNYLLEKITNKLRKSINKTVIVVSLIYTVFASIVTNTFAIFLLIPFTFDIFRKLKINKFTSFLSIFGAMLVGMLGATYGTTSLINTTDILKTSFGVSTVSYEIIVRFIFLCLITVLYNLFLYTEIKTDNQNKELQINFDLKDINNKKKTKMFPLYIVISLLLVFFILGFIDFDTIFKTKIFNKLHTNFMNLKVGKDFYIMQYFFGSYLFSFGKWNLLTYTPLIIISTLLIIIMYRIKINILRECVVDVTKENMGIFFIIIVIYFALSTTIYQSSSILNKITDKTLSKPKPTINIDYKGSNVAIFNIDTDNDKKPDYNLINQDLNNDGKCDLNCDTNNDGYPDNNLDINVDGASTDSDREAVADFNGESKLNVDVNNDNIPDVNINEKVNTLNLIFVSIINNIYNTDTNIAALNMAPILSSYYNGNSYFVICFIFTTIYSLMMFFLPTSLVLIIGLNLLNIKYKDWFNFIKRYLFALLILILILINFIK